MAINQKWRRIKKDKKKDKKSKDDGLSTIASDASLAQTLASNASTTLPPQQSNGPVFSGGQMFERYAKNGAMTPRAFLQISANEGLQPVHSRPMTVTPPTQQIGGGMRMLKPTLRLGAYFNDLEKVVVAVLQVTNLSK